jgi:hypothetical protein
MSMDEGWSILSADGQWPPDNPLSGMTFYSGPFPVLLLELFGFAPGLWVLRGVSVLANGAALVLIAMMLRRLHPRHVLWGWALPLIATSPVWLIVIRTGIEVAMFTPLLGVLGLYLLMLRTPWSAFGAGLSWGLLVYNHLIGLAFPIGVATAWLVVYRRLPRIPWVPALLGIASGLLPRALSVALYYQGSVAGTSAGQYDFEAAFADLRWLPKAVWETLHGETVYLRYVGRVAVEIWPYWLLGLLMFLPWLRRFRSPPRHVWFALVAAVAVSIFIMLGGPYLGVRFLVLPAIGFSAFLVLLGASAIQVAPRWAHLVRGTALAMVAANLFYLVSNFYLPWARRDLGITTFFLGARSPFTSSWGYLPKDEIERYIRQLTPAPEQIVTVNASLGRALRAALLDTPIRFTDVNVAHKNLRTVYVNYASGTPPDRVCLPRPDGELCFTGPVVVDTHFVIYR